MLLQLQSILLLVKEVIFIREKSDCSETSAQIKDLKCAIRYCFRSSGTQKGWIYIFHPIVYVAIAQKGKIFLDRCLVIISVCYF